jgi:hypothetical protein
MVIMTTSKKEINLTETKVQDMIFNVEYFIIDLSADLLEELKKPSKVKADSIIEELEKLHEERINLIGAIMVFEKIKTGSI